MRPGFFWNITSMAPGGVCDWCIVIQKKWIFRFERLGSMKSTKPILSLFFFFLFSRCFMLPSSSCLWWLVFFPPPPWYLIQSNRLVNKPCIYIYIYIRIILEIYSSSYLIFSRSRIIISCINYIIVVYF
jgi:hypothetical protein